MNSEASSNTEPVQYPPPRPALVLLSVIVIVLSIVLTVFLTLSENGNLSKPITAEAFPNTEIIELDTHSAFVSNINVDLQFPDNYGLQPSAPSQLELYSERQGLLSVYPLTAEQSRISLNRVILPMNVYLKLKLFYCRKSDQGLCLMKNVVFHVPVVRSKSPGELNLSYRVPPAEDIAKFD